MKRGLLFTVVAAIIGQVVFLVPSAAAFTIPFSEVYPFRNHEAMRLRRGGQYGGTNEHIMLYAYFPTPSPNLRIYLHDEGGLGSQGCANAKIRINGINQQNGCSGDIYYTLDPPSLVPGRSDWWRSPVDITLHGRGDASYKFTGHLVHSGAKLALHQASVLYGKNNYTIPFGIDSGCGQSAVVGSVGVRDPDSWGVRIELWEEGIGSPVAVGGPWYGSGTHSFPYNFIPGKRYELRADADFGGLNGKNNTIRLFWPGSSIYGDLAYTCRYDITPTLNPVAPRLDQGGPSIHPVWSATNSGNMSGTTHHQVTRFLYDAATKPFSSVNNQLLSSTAEPCAALLSPPFSGYRPGSCVVPLPGWGGTREFPVGTVGSDGPDNATTEPLGTIICYVYSINKPYTDAGSGIWRHSRVQCTKVVKHPKVHIIGGDLRSHGSIYAAYTYDPSTAPNNRRFGSWVEYGVFATGPNGIPQIASGIPSTSPYAFSIIPTYGDALSFTNLTPHTSGNFGPLTATDLVSNFPAPGPPSPCPGLVLSEGYHHCAGNVTLAGLGDPDVTGTVILRANTGTVTIAGDLTYPDGASYASIGELPQLVIIANRINIKSTVKRIDAWLITTGPQGIDTCYDGPPYVDGHNADGQVSALNCTEALTVNGPVKTDRLRLFRTAGAGNGSLSAPAEVFRFRPDAYLWLHQYRSGASRAMTNSLQELPPRY